MVPRFNIMPSNHLHRILIACIFPGLSNQSYVRASETNNSIISISVEGNDSAVFERDLRRISGFEKADIENFEIYQQTVQEVLQRWNAIDAKKKLTLQIAAVDTLGGAYFGYKYAPRQTALAEAYA